MESITKRQANSITEQLLSRLITLERRVEEIERREGISSEESYTVTNAVTDRTYDANGTSVAELADVLATLLSDLGLS